MSSPFTHCGDIVVCLLASASRLADVHRLVGHDASFALQSGTIGLAAPRGRQPFPLGTFFCGLVGVLPCPDNGPPSSLPCRDMEVALVTGWPFKPERFKRAPECSTYESASVMEKNYATNPDICVGMYIDSQAIRVRVRVRHAWGCIWMASCPTHCNLSPNPNLDLDPRQSTKLTTTVRWASVSRTLAPLSRQCPAQWPRRKTRLPSLL